LHLSRTGVDTSVPTLSRVVIESIEPQVDGGRFPIKRILGDTVAVQADIFADGHEVLSAVLLFRRPGEREWHEAPMRLLENDRWLGTFRITSVNPLVYTIQAWVDGFQTWAQGFIKKCDAGQDITVDLLIGAGLIRAAALRAAGEDSRKLGKWAAEMADGSAREGQSAAQRVSDAELFELMTRYPDRSLATTYPQELRVSVDREKARFSTWYEMFPRSCASQPGKHGTLRDCIDRLDYVAEMGFDVLYLPPIHPIGYSGRKGKNNSFPPSPEDTGSPWAIGSREGGHKAIHPQLGNLDDFHLLRSKAAERGLEIALDLAFQCSPDHPYVREHKQWFRLRPDGSIQYAENPPKRYQDIFPLDFESKQARELCEELKSVVLYWIAQGVKIFRVDNPHTKPFSFWEWLIEGIRRDYPETIFLAEAFTRPRIMYRLAKLGFTESYTYFAWKNSKSEITEYFTELATAPVREFFRANLWPNTPDILNQYLQDGGRPAFVIRLLLAATLGANYGIYGPAYELCENRAVEQGSEEYLDSEKYQLRVWPIDRADSLRGLISRVNAIRRETPALQSDFSLRFHPVDNDQLIAYSKMTEDLSEIILVIVSLDFRYKQSGWVQVPLDAFRLDPNQPFQVHDLLTGARYQWQGSSNYVELDPAQMPAHILKVR
jgi:starch synthase (maltosyl-transferring)